MLEIEFSAYVEGKKEGDNFSRLSITTTDFCLYVSTDLLIHPGPFSFSLIWNSLFVFESQSLFLYCKYFLRISPFFFFNFT